MISAVNMGLTTRVGTPAGPTSGSDGVQSSRSRLKKAKVSSLVISNWPSMVVIRTVALDRIVVGTSCSTATPVGNVVQKECNWKVGARVGAKGHPPLQHSRIIAYRQTGNPS